MFQVVLFVVDRLRWKRPVLVQYTVGEVPVHGPAQTTRMPVMVDLGGMAMPVLNDALVPIIVYHCVSERLRKEVNVVLYVHKNHTAYWGRGGAKGGWGGVQMTDSSRRRSNP